MTTPQGPHPVDARLEREDLLIIDWSDGSSRHYPIAHLRERCPCAHCSSPEATAAPAPLRPDLTLGSLEEVGNYAFRITFSDRHEMGIYTFAQLRSIGFPAEDAPAAFDV